MAYSPQLNSTARLPPTWLCFMIETDRSGKNGSGSLGIRICCRLEYPQIKSTNPDITERSIIHLGRLGEVTCDGVALDQASLMYSPPNTRAARAN
ncbi:MAG: hypothetical protein ACW98K_12905, partial [Candidatus Kariarchaeaceae archaeon]